MIISIFSPLSVLDDIEQQINKLGAPAVGEQSASSLDNDRVYGILILTKAVHRNYLHNTHYLFPYHVVGYSTIRGISPCGRNDRRVIEVVGQIRVSGEPGIRGGEAMRNDPVPHAFGVRWWSILIALLAFSAGWLWAPYLPSLPELASGWLARPASPEEAALAQLYERVLPSVVSVKGIAGSRLGAETGAEPAAGPGQGSGFVWDKAGHIVTNFNIVQAAQCIEVVLADGAQAGAELVGRDISTNLAVLKIDLPPDRLQPATLGDSARLAVGQPVLAISAPPGEGGMMMNGLISSLDRTMDGCDSCYPIAEVIQAEIGLQPEDSGGPLFNEQGEVIGVNTWIVRRGGSGISFALPVRAIEQLIPALIGDD